MGFLLDTLAKASGRDQVSSGEIIPLKTDLIIGHDGTWEKVEEAWKKSSYQMAADCNLLFTLDHAFPAPTVSERNLQKQMLLLSREKNFELYNHGEGVLHQVIAESGKLYPGMIIVGADGHVATAGAFGVLAFAEKPGVVAGVIETGIYELKVPEVITFVLDGNFAPHVMARDAALYLLGNYSDRIRGKAVALRGTAIDAASPDSLMTICNLLPESGAVTAFVPPRESDLEGETVTVEVQSIDRLVALPPAPTNVSKISDLRPVAINVAIIGGCSSGRMEDMQAAAEVLRGQKIHPDVTLIITPASASIADEMDAKGLTAILRASGAVIMPPGCGPCPGKHFGVLSPEDTAITTTIRNSPGRIGAQEAKIYLASPYSAALAALRGNIS